VTHAIQYLVVLQTEDLCLLFREFLEKEGYEGVCVSVDSESERNQVQQLLARRQFDLVLIQESVRWYPPKKLVDDVKEMDGEGRSEVVCLAYDRDGRALSQFMQAGGAGFVPFDMGHSDLKEVFAQAHETAEESRKNKEPKKDKVLRAIDRYSKEVGFHQFALAMFDELYPAARLTHGTLEKGKDIICWEINKMGFREYVGVQIKLGDVDGSVGKDGAAELFRQVLEGLGLPDDVDEGTLYMDKFVVMVSGVINKAARGRLNEFVRRYRLDRRVFFLDRNNIAAAVVEHCPRFFATLK
jgi:hypothetical protein